MSYSIVVTGGTVLCAENDQGLNVPVYDDWHIQEILTILKYKSELGENYEKLKKQILDTKNILFQPDSEEKQKQLEKTKIEIHHNIYNAILDKLNHEDNSYQLFVRNMSDLKGSGGKVVSPYVIDSIKFDFSEHYYSLLQSVEEQIKDSNSVIIVGGTDTIQYYATALTKHLKARGSLSGDKKIFFLSSMGNLEHHAEHNAKLFEVATKLAENPEVPGAGGYILSSTSEDASKVKIHDATNSFVKISSRLLDAFRSLYTVGRYKEGMFIKNKDYTVPNAFLEYVGKGGANDMPPLNRVAPPLLRSNGQEEVLKYLDTLIAIHPPITSATIEINPIWMLDIKDGKFQEIKSKIKGLTSAGTEIILNNFYVYSDKKNTIEPKFKKKSLSKNNFFNQLLECGAIYEEKTTKGCVVNSLIKHLNGKSFTAIQINPKNKKTGKEAPIALSIGYIPDQAVFTEFCKALKNQGVTGLSIAGLPGSVLPEKIVESLKKTYCDNFNISFAGNENVYPLPENPKQTFTEGEDVDKAHYAEGAEAAKYASPLSPGNAVNALRNKICAAAGIRKIG